VFREENSDLQSNLNELQQICKQLTETELRWLSMRTRCDSNAEASRRLGLDNSTFYRYPHKDLIDEAVRLIKLDGVTVAREMLLRNSGKAAEVMVGLVDGAESESVKLKAATEVLDRVGLAGSTKHEISGELDTGMEHAANRFDELLAGLIAARRAGEDPEG